MASKKKKWAKPNIAKEDAMRVWLAGRKELPKEAYRNLKTNVLGALDYSDADAAMVESFKELLEEIVSCITGNPQRIFDVLLGIVKAGNLKVVVNAMLSMLRKILIDGDFLRVVDHLLSEIDGIILGTVFTDLKEDWRKQGFLSKARSEEWLREKERQHCYKSVGPVAASVLKQYNKPVRWPAATAKGLSYAFEGFSEDELASVRVAVATATASWHGACNARFVELEEKKDREPHFRIVRDPGNTGVYASAFFPEESIVADLSKNADKRRVIVGDPFFQKPPDPAVTLSSFQAGILRHELGHVLGFVHSFWKRKAEFKDQEQPYELSYDEESVMGYWWMPELYDDRTKICKSMELSPTDCHAAARLYGLERMSDLDFNMCAAALKWQMPVPSAPTAAVVPGNSLDAVRWENGTRLQVFFQEGKHIDKAAQIIQWAQEWSEHANITFERTMDQSKCDIRVSFDDSGCWSYMGKTCKDYAQQGHPSMNYKWVDRPTVLHEFGHALGLGHEHQSPSTAIAWNVAEVNNYFTGWDVDKIKSNVLEVYNSTSYTAYDKSSIMHYAYPAKLVNGAPGDWYSKWNTELSDTDKIFIAQVYPKGTSSSASAMDEVAEEDQ